MVLSSQSLFHFTSFDNLISILNSKCFRVKYSIETFEFYDVTSFYIPMVCFCDIPLTMTNEHIEDYDGYAIGLKKDWAIGHGLNPVFYINEMGTTVPLGELAHGVLNNTIGKKAHDFIFCFLKPYSGKNYKNPKKEKKCFYNEKEWRYVPYLAKFKDGYDQFYTEKNFPVGLNDEIINHRLYFLKFGISDINFLIVKTEEKRKEIIDMLQNSELSEALKDQTIKVISIKEIFENF